MSWLEKIERYKTEQQQVQEEAVRLKSEAGLRIAKEKIPPLLAALERDPRYKEMLTQIRNDVWELGEIFIAPALDKIAPGTPLFAEVVLEAKWSIFREAGESFPDDSGRYASYSWPDHLYIHEERLAIRASSGDNGRISIAVLSGPAGCQQKDVSFGLSLYLDDPETPQKVEKYLIKECIERQRLPDLFPSYYRLPYNQRKFEAETEIIQAIIQRGFRDAPQYLLNRARELQ